VSSHHSGAVTAMIYLQHYNRQFFLMRSSIVLCVCVCACVRACVRVCVRLPLTAFLCMIGDGERLTILKEVLSRLELKRETKLVSLCVTTLWIAG
jgi:hypothetical protein